MWLLNASTQSLEHIVQETRVYNSYAIVSHTWEKDEVTFQDILEGAAEARLGYLKVKWACLQAQRDGIQYVWIDTACIDKTSSAELSEAINSMFRWYRKARVCYAYLSDVPAGFQRSHCTSDKDISCYLTERQDYLARCRWISRGWTLQELIAPDHIKFFDAGWELIGDKAGMVATLAHVTGVDMDVLMDPNNLGLFSVATRMSWAAKRSTSREEDQAYCLMGLFDVHMSLLYGEGSKAFLRLQHKIIKTSLDHSVLVWEHWERSQPGTLLSPSPYGFRNAQGILSWTYPDVDNAFALSNRGLRINLPALMNGAQLMAVLNCRYVDRPRTHIALRLQKQSKRLLLSPQPLQQQQGTVCQLSLAVDHCTNRDTHLETIGEQTLLQAVWHDLIILHSPVDFAAML